MPFQICFCSDPVLLLLLTIMTNENFTNFPSCSQLSFGPPVAQGSLHSPRFTGTECARRHTGTRRLAARPLCAAAALLTLMNGECAPPCHAHGCHGHAGGEDGEGDGKADGVDGGDNGS